MLGSVDEGRRLDREREGTGDPSDAGLVAARELGSPSRSAARAGSAQSLLRIIAFILALAVASAAGGLAISLVQGRRYTATTTAILQPDPDLLNATSSVASDVLDRYVQSQVIALESLNRGVNGDHQAGSPKVTVRQVGLANVVEISATAANSTSAIDAANRLMVRYTDTRRQQLSDRAQATAGQAKKQVDTVTQALESPSARAAASGAGESALVAEYGRLLSLISQVQITAANADPDRVLEWAQAATVTRSSQGARNSLIGGLLGALAAVAALAARQRLRVNS
jgi:hypothetical protein